MARGFGASEGRVRLYTDEKGKSFYRDDTSGKIGVGVSYEKMGLGPLAAELARLKRVVDDLEAKKATGALSQEDEKKLSENQFKLKHSTDVHSKRWDAKTFDKKKGKMGREYKKLSDDELIKKKTELQTELTSGEYTRRDEQIKRETSLIRDILREREYEKRDAEIEKKYASETASYKKAAKHLSMKGNTLPKEFDPVAFGVPTDSKGWVSLDTATKTNEGKALLSRLPVGKMREAEAELVQRAPDNIFLDHEDDGEFSRREIGNTLVEEIEGKQGKFEVKVVSKWLVSHGYDNSYTELDREVFVRKVEG